MRLRGLHAVVTGASRGLGVGIASALASAGARVTVVAENAAELARACEALRPAGDVAAACIDLSDRAAVLAFGARIAEGPEAADVLVNNAAVLPIRPVEDTSDAVWDRTLAVNLTAPFLLLRAVAPRLAVHGGAVINVSSRAGVLGFAEETAYCAAKFGIEGLTRAAALEWRGKPVSINTVTPGARIKPTGITAEEFATWMTERQAALTDPLALGPAFVLLASLRGEPSGCRFDAWRLTQAIASRSDALDPAALRALAEAAAD